MLKKYPYPFLSDSVFKYQLAIHTGTFEVANLESHKEFCFYLKNFKKLCSLNRTLSILPVTVGTQLVKHPVYIRPEVLNSALKNARKEQDEFRSSFGQHISIRSIWGLQ